MPLKKAGQFLKEHGYSDVQFDTKEFQECVNRRFEEEYKEMGADAFIYVQGCRLRTAPDHLKKLGFDDKEEFAESHTGLEAYNIRALQVDDQYLANAIALLKMFDYRITYVNHARAYHVQLT